GCASLIVGNAYQAQMPEFAHDLGHADGGITYSALLGADAAGALAAGLILEGRGLLPPNPRTALVLAILWCVAIGAFALSALGLRAFSGLTVGLGGSVIGIHWSLAISAAVLFAITALFLALRPS